MYGRDGAASQTEPAEGEPYYLPVFGIVRNNRTALFAVIESGDAGSEITAKLGEPNGRYYTVYNTFSWTRPGVCDAGGQGGVQRVDPPGCTYATKMATGRI